MLNALSIDVEEYFQVSNFEKVVRREDWINYTSRAEKSTDTILTALDEHATKATFFILGWVAERNPLLVQRIEDCGHEVACHGFGHELIYKCSPEQFRQDIRKAKSLLEDITGRPVVGYRAPRYSITDETLWALDILIEEGFEYDSSIFPIRHDRYGIHRYYRFPHQVRRNGSGVIKEFPISTVRVTGINLPVSGGGYFRLLPYWLTRKGLRRINEKDHHPFIFYLHPWEFDHEQPRICAGLTSRFRHCVNLSKTEERFNRLLGDFEFTTVKGVLEALFR